jgi:hypothetical protein
MCNDSESHKDSGTSSSDRKLVLKALELFLLNGALSQERLLHLLNIKAVYYSARDVKWVLNQLDAQKNASELYTLPDSMLPKNWR